MSDEAASQPAEKVAAKKTTTTRKRPAKKSPAKKATASKVRVQMVAKSYGMKRGEVRSLDPAAADELVRHGHARLL